jgi:AcrR family transcriptional regulator
MNKAERRRELLRAARTVFARRGYHDAKIDEIVAEAKVSKGTFYLYFPDKRSVFEQLVDNLFHQLSQAIIRVETTGDVEEQVRQNIRAILDALLSDPALTLIFFSYAAGLDPEFVQKVRSFTELVRQILETALRDGQALGIVAPGDPALYATFTFGGLQGLVLEAAHRGPLDEAGREQLVDGLFRVLDHGYLRISPRPSSPPAAES